MEYEIVEGNSIRALEGRVNDRIEDGWVTQGGVAFCETISGSRYTQAIVRKTKRGNTRHHTDLLRVIISMIRGALKAKNTDVRALMRKGGN